MTRLRSTVFALLLVSAGATVFTGQQPANARCDRPCLTALVDTYLAALVAHDPSRVTIASGAKFVENITPMNAGEGLWKTATAVPTTFKIYVPDPVSGQVGFLGVMQETGKPIQLALRLKVDQGRIVEMEHLIARNLSERGLANLQTVRSGLLAPVPAEQRSTREQLLKIGASYYDALDDNEGGKAPFADDCVRHENGMQTSTNSTPSMPGAMGTLGTLGCAAQISTGTFTYIDRIDNRRVEIADVETGLVFGLSHFRHSMKEKSVTIKGVPNVEKVDLKIDAFDLPAANIYKVRGGRIHEIEAMGFVTAYNSKTGWE
jgi:hypothetical protein